MQRLLLVMGKILLPIMVLIAINMTTDVWAQEGDMGQSIEETFEGEILRVAEQNSQHIAGQDYLDVTYELRATSGVLEGRTIPITLSGLAVGENGQLLYQPGDIVIVNAMRNAEGKKVYFIADFVRKDGIYKLLLLFLVAVLVVAGWWGIRSLLGLGFSFLVIFGVILPLINQGWNPVLTAILGSGLIMVVTFYLSHGFTGKTHVALGGTLIALTFTGILAHVFTDLTRITGYGNEEAMFLEVMKKGAVNVQGLVLAGIIIGTLGVLDDITISQSAVVERLRFANPKFSKKQIFWQAMTVGRDHISSLVNTLVLVYAGGALPLLLLFVNSSQSFGTIINYEPIAEEIVRTLVGSIGLISAVPITTLMAAYIEFKTDKKNISKEDLEHGHVH